MRIPDRVFLVTGGASGLGRAVAEHLSAAGARVVVADIAEDGGAVAAAIGCRFVRTDVADEAEGRAAVAACLEAHGRLDGLVTCAGIVTGARVLGRSGPHDLDSFARTVRVNLVGTFNMVRLAAEAIAGQAPDAGGSRGVIVTTSSIAAFDGQVGQAAYAASKGGVASLTLPLARDLASHGIRVVSVAPGIFETPMMAGLAPEVQEALGRSVPFPPRLGRPAEFAGLVAHIIENDMLNGEVIRLDGALRMAPR
ncbi:SDR family NAD(P)-dependent oxidoreductase [Methylobacterium symbioticum]|uniref:Putative oxidoreductase n=1 Tax=Methylobacterium symbioticum TaxID=2584084 RepID=A0A509EMS8_9HYPH|nr:SDR family NAD(P)-dependent oxidoreductase [Methylobacterium symbioticum]VUD74553.1 putative oxidoreductase [Methylobacterium symbioticum]